MKVKSLITIMMTFSLISVSSTSWAGSDEPVLLKGVPILYQHDIDFWPNSRLKRMGPSGCGPVAAASVFLWFYQLGYNDLLPNSWDKTTSGGQVKWKRLTRRLSLDYLNTKTTHWGSYTMPNNLEDGIQDYLDSKLGNGRVGSGGTVTRMSIYDVDASDGYNDIKKSINSGRPVIMLYNANLPKGELGGNFTKRNHYAVIYGYHDKGNGRSRNKILINGGNGWSDTETVNWKIGDGRHQHVKLFFVNPKNSTRDMSKQRCLNSRDEDLVDSQYVAFTAYDISGSAYPVLSKYAWSANGSSADIANGYGRDQCSRIGGKVD